MISTVSYNGVYSSTQDVHDSINAAMKASMRKTPSLSNGKSADCQGSTILLSMLEKPVLFHKSKVKNLDEVIKFKIQSSKSSLVLTSSDKIVSVSHNNHHKELCQESDLIQWSKHRLRAAIRFRNHGNSCYLNAVLQCILATVPFVGFCETVHHEPKKCVITTKGKFCNICEISRLLKAQQIGNQTVIYPLRFLNNIKSIMSSLSYDNQEDAHEYFLGVLAQMEENSLGSFGNVPLKVRETNPIRKIFGGVTRSTVVCQTCHKVSNRDEHMFNLSLDITKADNIQHCLQNSTHVEHLKGANAYKCESCKQLRHAKRHVTVHTAPRILTIQLNRFTRFHKIDRNVSFQVSLNLRPYMTVTSGPSVLYQLFATVTHRGHSCRSGHYIAYTRRHNQWQCLNDDMVHAVSSAEVLRSHPYLLFYQRVDQLQPQIHKNPSNGVAFVKPNLNSKNSQVMHDENHNNSNLENSSKPDGVVKSPAKYWLVPCQRIDPAQPKLKPQQKPSTNEQLEITVDNSSSSQLVNKHLKKPTVGRWDTDFSHPKLLIKRSHNDSLSDTGEPSGKSIRLDNQHSHSSHLKTHLENNEANGNVVHQPVLSPPVLPPSNCRFSYQQHNNNGYKQHQHWNHNNNYRGKNNHHHDHKHHRGRNRWHGGGNRHWKPDYSR